VADTVKGRGIPFMENTWKFHNYALSEEEYRKALAELEA
jgi:transketolase